MNLINKSEKLNENRGVEMSDVGQPLGLAAEECSLTRAEIERYLAMPEFAKSYAGRKLMPGQPSAPKPRRKAA